MEQRAPSSHPLHFFIGVFLLIFFFAGAFVACSTTTDPGNEKKIVDSGGTKNEPAQNLPDTTKPEPSQPEPSKSEPGVADKVTSPDTTKPDAGPVDAPAPPENSGDAGTTDSAVTEGTPAEKGPCLGVKPGEGAWTAPEGYHAEVPTPEVTDGGAGEAIPESIPEADYCKYYPGQCKGAPLPGWTLQDIQPLSCGYKAYYGLKPFKGLVTVVVLLAAW